MTQLAIIGGTGLTQLSNLSSLKHERMDTPFGRPSAEFVLGEFNGKSVVFLARHGNPHTLAPHVINYRANIWGLQQLGVEQIIAVAAVGGITSAMRPAHIAIPDQVIDYTYGRKHTFFADGGLPLTHIDFTWPYTPALRGKLIAVAAKVGVAITSGGTYGCTQGPRLETIAEIRRMARDGCDVVGMTGMPEAALARELGMDYAAIAVIANWAAGKGEGEISMAEIEQNLHVGMANTASLLKAFIEIG